MIRKAAETALRGLGSTDAELSVLLTDDSEIRSLNKRFRKMDKATDVLSFPLDDPSVLGDVVISVETAERQAVEYGVGRDEELCRLLVHGILHLLGYDHVKGGRQARLMKAKEAELMGRLKEKGLY